MHGADIHTGCRETGFEMIGEQIVAHAPHHPHGYRIRSQPRGRAGLVPSLAAWNHLEIASENGLPWRGKMIHRHHEVHVETAHHHQRGHRAKSMPNFFSSSA